MDCVPAPASERALKDKQDPILPVLPPVFTVQLCVLELHLPLTLSDALGLYGGGKRKNKVSIESF